MMAKYPENLHKFYNEDSHFLHSDLNHPNGVNGSGPESIRSVISTLNLKNTKVDLSNGYIDAQKSTNNGVVVVVVGQLSFPGGPAKPFVQSFLLSNQASSAYYVSNSVFRLLVPSEEQGDINSVLVNLAPPAAQPTPAAAWTAPETKPVPAASPAPEENVAVASVDATGDRLSGYVAVEALLQEAANEVEEPVSAPEPVAVPEPAPAPVVEVAKPVVVAPVAAPADPKKKLNYSDIVKKVNSGAAPAAPAAAPVVAPRPTPAPVAAPAPVATSSSYSVYIKQVPEATTSAELHTLFSAFGHVVSVDQQAGKSFAFVKFDSATAVQAALQASTLTLHGQNLRVEERSRPAGSSSGAGANQSNNHGRGRDRDHRDRSGRDGHKDNRDREHKGDDRAGSRKDGDRPRDGNKGGNKSTGNNNTSKAK